MHVFGIVLASLLAGWNSLPALVKAYILLATARALLSLVAGLIRTRPFREIARDNLLHIVAFIGIVLIWGAGIIVAHETLEFAQVFVLASKLLSIWFAAYTLMQILDDLSVLGVPVPEQLRERIRTMIGNNTNQKRKQDDNCN